MLVSHPILVFSTEEEIRAVIPLYCIAIMYFLDSTCPSNTSLEAKRAPWISYQFPFYTSALSSSVSVHCSPKAFFPDRDNCTYKIPPRTLPFLISIYRSYLCAAAFDSKLPSLTSLLPLSADKTCSTVKIYTHRPIELCYIQ